MLIEDAEDKQLVGVGDKVGPGEDKHFFQTIPAKGRTGLNPLQTEREDQSAPGHHRRDRNER